MYKLAIVGGRDFDDIGLMAEKLSKFLEDKNIPQNELTIVSGLASGADSLGLQLAHMAQVSVIECPALWNDLNAKPCKVRINRYGKPYNVLAGFNRNQQMRDISDGILAFWDGKSPGTKEMIQKSIEQGLDVEVIKY